MVWYVPEERSGLRGSLRRVRLLKTDDSGTQQKMKLVGLKSEELDEIVRVQGFGLSSNPSLDSEGVLLTLGGRSDRAMVIGVEHKTHRPTNLQPGETALYDAYGKILKLVEAEVFLDAGGKPVRVVNATTVTVEASETITLKAPTIVLDGSVKLGGPDANRPLALEGSIDTDGDAEVGNLATMVVGK